MTQRNRSAIDGGTTRHASYRRSQKIRNRVEEVFGRKKTVGGFGKIRYLGVERTGLAVYFVATAYNFVRMANLPSCEKPRAVHQCDLFGV